MNTPNASHRPCRAVPLFLALILLAGSAAGASDGTDAAAVRAHVTYLASDDLGGRLTGTEGAAMAASYLVQQLQALGAQPLPEQGDFRIPFEFTAGVNDGGSALAAGEAGNWTGPESVQALSFSDDVTVEGGLVFAGYGLVLPDSQGYPYDSYTGLDVTDKIAVVLRYFPEDVDQDARAVLSRYSGLRYKAMQARQHGARGMIVITGPRSPNAGEMVPMTFDTAVAGSGIAAASASGEVAAALFAAARRDLQQVQAELDTGNPHAAGFDLGTHVNLQVSVVREVRTGYNVAGYLPGSAAQRDKPWVILGAHYDHLGDGRGGNSLAGRDEVGQIHNGADDNASGVAGVLAAASRLASMPRARNVAFTFWSGEELGLLGAQAFVQSAPVAMEQVAGYVNFDMIGRARDNKLVIQATGTAAAWPSLIERSNVPVGLDITLQEDPNVPTDSSAFNQAQVPTLAFFTGSHEDYHRPSDDTDTLNYDDLARVAQLGALVVDKLANLDEAPQFVAVAPSSAERGDRDAVRVFTGTIPDYAAETEGLLLGGVIEGGPADEAGLQKGDVIVEFAGQTITNIYDYTYALEAVRVDVAIKVVYVRDGERVETTMTPRARR